MVKGINGKNNIPKYLFLLSSIIEKISPLFILVMNEQLKVKTTPKLENMASMCSLCTELTNITFGTDCTFEKCTDMIQIFYQCHELKELNFKEK